MAIQELVTNYSVAELSNDLVEFRHVSRVTTEPRQVSAGER